MSNRNRHRFDSAKASQAARFAETLADALHDLRLTHMDVAGKLGLSLYTVDSWTRAGDDRQWTGHYPLVELPTYPARSPVLWAATGY
jgi:hypothetical protein